VGKTTLLHILLGLSPPDSGEVLFFEKSNIGYGAGHIKQLIGMVSQNDSVPFDLSVQEYVLLGRAPHLKLLEIPGEDDRGAVKNALETIGMTHMATWGMSRLSSGEKQLVNVARALTQNPEILLLDEPCSHLDLINSRHMLNLMKTIVRKGRTVVFTTHDPNAAAAVADQVVLLKKGSLVAKGPPEQTLTQELLTETYGGTIEVIHTARGPLVLAI
jgi:iron complex transport system ATP-binding protein